MKLNQYFDHILCINLGPRTDRWEHVQAECKKHDFTVERFEGYIIDQYPTRDGNTGCTASHRGVLEVVAYHRWNRVLVLEDDFEVIVPNLNEAFAEAVSELNEEWDFLYLGGSYQSDPQYRHSKHIIRNNGMHTTSSYGITWQAARRIAPAIYGIGPIDTLYADRAKFMRSFTIDPRLMVQMTSYSDLQNRVCENAGSMTDPHHVARLDGLEP